VSEVPPSPEDSDEVDALYRRASARDASRPSESVRRAVLDHAAQLAVKRTGATDSARSGTWLRAKRQAWWMPAALGTLAAAALAGFLVIPQYLWPQGPINPASSPAPATTPAGDAKTQNVVVSAAKRMPAEGRNRQSLQEAAREQSAAGAPSVAGKPSAPTAQSVPSAPSEQGNAQPAARSARSVASGTSALSYSSPPQPASFTSAARTMDPAAQLRQAAESGNVPAMQDLLAKQPVIDARDASGRTALMLATLHGRTEAVDVLLSAGADPNAADARGTTPLQAALARDQPAIAAALRRAGAR
jgi:hypothetical protein